MHQKSAPASILQVLPCKTCVWERHGGNAHGRRHGGRHSRTRKVRLRQSCKFCLAKLVFGKDMDVFPKPLYKTPKYTIFKTMKRVFFQSIVIFAVVISIAFFASCSTGGDSVSLSGSQDTWNGRIVKWQPNPDPNKTNPAQIDYFYELPGDVRTLLVDVTNSKPLDIHIVKMNLSDSVVPAHQVQYVVKAAYSEKSLAELFPNASSRSANEADFFSAKEYAAIESNIDYTKMFDSSGDVPIHIDYAPARDFVPPETLNLSATGRAASDMPMYNSSSQPNQIAGNVDTDTLDLYVDLPRGSYSQKTATLRYKSDTCYVWVLDEYFTNETGSRTDDKVTSAQATNVGKKFDEIYPYITNVFGNESNEIYDVTNNSVQKASMGTKSPTGTRVNIVLYDIEGDYKLGRSSLTLGYFWAKDYYTKNFANYTSSAAIKLTNEGKYFYIDSYALNNFEKETYSTLAHEFQHMVHFNRKNMLHDETSSTWYNEMLSMLCEDMMQEKLDVPDADSPKNRMQGFCSEYYLSGVTDWLSGSDALKSYAGAYMFGAYLARNYGGADFVKTMSTNEYVDFASVTNATGKSLSEIFKGYAEALVFLNTPFNLPSGAKTFNQNAATTLSHDSYNYPMTAIDLPSPKRFDNGAGSRVSLRPYGFSLHRYYSTKTTKYNAKTFIFYFSSPVNSNAKVYMLVEKCNHASHIVN